MKSCSLLFFGGCGFQVFDGFGSFMWFYGQVANELEMLAIHAGGHQCEEHGIGAYHGNNGGAYLVGSADNEVAGIGNGGASGFADDADVMAFLEEFFCLGGVGWIVLVHEQELQAVYVDRPVEGFEETAGGPFVFHEEDA